MFDRDKAREEWRLASLQWCHLDDAAARLEEGRITLIATQVLELTRIEGKSVAMAEKIVRASDEYRDYVDAMHDARKAATEARIERDNLDRIYWRHASDEANARAEMKLQR